MRAIVRNSFAAVIGVCMLLLGACSGATTIKSDLVLDADSTARIQLHQKTEAIDLFNDSDAAVRILVLDKKDRVISNMLLAGQDQARLDLMKARAVQFNNDSASRATIKWTLRNNSRIQYDLALNPDTY
jgi:hypothetical protein